MLHYQAKNFFAMVIIKGYLTDSDELEVYIVSDNVDPITNVTVTVSLFSWGSLEPVYVKTTNDLTVSELRSISVKLFFSTRYCCKTNCYWN